MVCIQFIQFYLFWSRDVHNNYNCTVACVISKQLPRLFSNQNYKKSNTFSWIDFYRSKVKARKSHTIIPGFWKFLLKIKWQVNVFIYNTYFVRILPWYASKISITVRNLTLNTRIIKIRDNLKLCFLKYYCYYSTT